MHASAPDAPTTVALIAEFRSTVSRLQAGGPSGLDTLAYLVRVLSKELSSFTQDAVLRKLIDFRTSEGTVFADYPRNLRILVSNVQWLSAEMTPDQAQVQSAIETAIQDQFPVISSPCFCGSG